MICTSTERGNTLLTGDGRLAAWLRLEGNERLEVTYSPGSYPALNVRVVSSTDKQLAKHINANLGGWFVQKCNLAGVKIDADGCVREKAERA